MTIFMEGCYYSRKDNAPTHVKRCATNSVKHTSSHVKKFDRGVSIWADFVTEPGQIERLRTPGFQFGMISLRNRAKLKG